MNKAQLSRIGKNPTFHEAGVSAGVSVLKQGLVI